MTKTQLKRALRAANEPDTNRAIAELFGIKEQAVQAWSMHGPIPPLRVYELRERRPELFTMRSKR